jgi:DNA-binding transcriptional ArsR family regulator
MSAITARRSRATPTYAESAPLFAALGDATRLALVARLSQDGPLSIVRLTEGSSVTRQAVTKHLGALSSAGLVKSERAGRERIWRLEPQRFADVRSALEHISARWDAALDRLRSLVEED